MAVFFTRENKKDFGEDRQFRSAMNSAPLVKGNR